MEHQNRPSPFFPALLLTALVLAPTLLRAQTAWDGEGGNTDYSNNLNWAGNSIPGNGNANGALIGNSSTQTVVYNTATGYPGTYGTDFRVETSDSLPGTWTQEDVPPALGATVTLSGNNVTYTFPGGPAYSARKFAHLKLIGP